MVRCRINLLREINQMAAESIFSQILTGNVNSQMSIKSICHNCFLRDFIYNYFMHPVFGSYPDKI